MTRPTPVDKEAECPSLFNQDMNGGKHFYQQAIADRRTTERTNAGKVSVERTNRVYLVCGCGHIDVKGLPVVPEPAR